MGTKNDKLILALKKEVEEKKAQIASLGKFSPHTNCSFDYAGVRINIHTATKETLLLLISYVQSLKKGLAEIYPEEVLVINGFNVDDWLSDLKAKFEALTINQKKTHLKNLEEKLHSLLSNDTKVSLEIEELKKSING